MMSIHHPYGLAFFSGLQFSTIVGSNSFLSRVLGVLLIAAPCATAAPGPNWQTGIGFRFSALPVPEKGKPGFSVMSPRSTGITFSNSVAMSKMLENHNLMNGSGVAAGDFDGDGLCDLYFCAIDGTNALYRNLGNWRFENVTEKAGVGCPGWRSTGAVFADVDGDGRLDLLIGALGTGCHCFRNEGGGQFKDVTAESGLTGEAGTMSLALGDLNGDGSLDLFVANYGANSLYRSGGSAQVRLVNGQWIVEGPNAKRLRYVDGRIEELGEPSTLYLNDGKGHFSAVPWNSNFFLDVDGKPMPPMPDFSLSVNIRDINGDGAPDIYICNDFASPDRLWLNDGTGHFRALPLLGMRDQSASSMGVDFADLDRDGYFDFFTTEMRGRGHAHFIRQAMTVKPQPHAIGQFQDRPQVSRNCLFHNRGDATFDDLAYWAGVQASDWSWQPLFLDVDLDGYEDLLIGNGMKYDLQDKDTHARMRSVGKQTPEQSRTNLLMYPSYLTPNVAWRNRHDFSFEDVSKSWGFDSMLISQGAALADLDGDGALDVIFNCFEASPLLYRNLGSAPRLAVRLKGKVPNVQGIGALIRVYGGPVQVQMQEIQSGSRYLSGDDTMRSFAAGSPTNDLRIEVTWRSGSQSIVAHAKPNCIYEVEEAGAGAAKPKPLPAPAALFRDVSELLDHTHHEEPADDFGQQPLLHRLLSQGGPGVAWVDLDGDGHDELAIGSGAGGSLQVFRRDIATGKFTEAGRTPPLPEDSSGLALVSTPKGQRALLIGLANLEAKPPCGSAVVSCGLTLGAREIAPGPLDAIGAWQASTGPLAVADIDGDGTLQIFVGGRVISGAYPRAASSQIFRQSDGKLLPDPANNKALENVGLVNGAVWSDLDGDGFPELVLACEWGPVKVFKNDHGHLRDATVELGFSGFTGWWNSVTTGDFDGDGRLDIVAGNWGLNDNYRASQERPLKIYYGDLAESGSMDLLESYFAEDAGAEVPRRALGALAQAFPVFSAHYLSNEMFSKATISEILGILPGKSQDVEAVTLASMLFLNRGGKFEAVPLPREAQVAPAFSLNVADVDGDGAEDLFISQNCFAVRPEWERQDAGRGLWLKGDGKGNLKPIPGQESGVMVYGEQRGAALGDFNEDGRVDLLVAQNGARTRLFENVGARPGLRVKLSGPTGNPMGLGASVRLKFDDGYGPLREIHGGSGYWSQDSPVPVLAVPRTPRALEVRWPGGKTTSVPVPENAREIIVSKD